MKNGVVSCEQSVLSIIFSILKVSTENSEIAKRERKSVSPTCASDGVAISCAFTKVKLADGFRGKIKRLHMYSYMNDESM